MGFIQLQEDKGSERSRVKPRNHRINRKRREKGNEEGEEKRIKE